LRDNSPLCDNYFTEVATSPTDHLMLSRRLRDHRNANKNRTSSRRNLQNSDAFPKALENAKLTWATYGDPGFSLLRENRGAEGSKNILPWTIDRTRGREIAERVVGGTRRAVRGAFRATRPSGKTPGRRREAGDQ